MTSQHLMTTLVLAIVLAFGVGYLVGTGQRPPELPLNYNPALQVQSDALKAAQEQTRTCYMAILEMKNAKADPSAATH